MNQSVLMYQDLLADAMNIPCADTSRYLNRLRPLLELFLEDSPEPTLDDLIQAFGPADHMAQILLSA